MSRSVLGWQVSAPPVRRGEEPRRDAAHDEDFFAWTIEQARALRGRAGEASVIDWANLAEEIEDLGKRDQREVESRAVRIVQHLLKQRYQPERRTRSWDATVNVQRADLRRVLRDSPSLIGKLTSAYDDIWERARLEAVRDTNLPIETFPAEPIFGVERMLDDDYAPELGTDDVTGRS